MFNIFYDTFTVHRHDSILKQVSKVKYGKIVLKFKLEDYFSKKIKILNSKERRQ